VLYMCLITAPFSELTLGGNLGLQRHSKDKSQQLGIEAQQIQTEARWKFSNKQGN